MTHRFSGFRRTAGAEPGQRQRRVGEVIRKTLSAILSRGDIYHPAIEGTIISISEVRVSPDLKNATVYAIALGDGDTMALIEGLLRVRKPLRGMLAREVRLKHIPDLMFEADNTYDHAETIDHLLKSERVAPDLGAGEGVSALVDDCGRKSDQ